ncbi:MAG TPA: polysaccharide deacetylase family protein [Solirubrobacteraceae bacterium]|jgi:peptidoglycan/xylan/chitin deacetylase (PgdA/CDA1 family)
MGIEQAPTGAGRVGGVCTFTFDDGPDPIWTPRVLAELDRCEASATFFVVGERLADDPGPVRAALEAGHEVELHCHHHIRHTELSEAELEADTTAALAALARAGLGRPRYWRTPWGVRTTATARVAARHRLRLVDWTIDTHDWRGDASAAMLDTAVGLLRDGAVVLMHDALGPGALRSNVEETINLIAPLAALARGRDLRLAALSQADAPGTIENDAPLVRGVTAQSMKRPALEAWA